MSENESQRRKRRAWRRATIVLLCVGVVLLALYLGTLYIEHRHRATEQELRDLYYGSQTGRLVTQARDA